MSNYQTVNLPRDLAELIAKVCMFTLPADASQQLRTILAKPTGEPAAWFDPVHNDFLTATGRATTISMGDGDRLARYTVPLYAAPTAAEELDSVRHWRAKHDVAVRELAAFRLHKTDYMQAAEETRSALVSDVERLRGLSVTNILMSVTPGLDGEGQENYAESIGEVEQLLSGLVDQRYSFETAYKEWIDKSEWVRQELQPRELGMHLADVIKQRHDILLAERNQLLVDLTALDEKLDQTQDRLGHMVYDYRSVVQAGYDRITALGSDCDSVAKMLDDNPNYQKALALLMPDLESRPEERGTPETEPCSGCGTPGWTGSCNKCVPY